MAYITLDWLKRPLLFSPSMFALAGACVIAQPGSGKAKGGGSEPHLPNPTVQKVERLNQVMISWFCGKGKDHDKKDSVDESAATERRRALERTEADDIREGEKLICELREFRSRLSEAPLERKKPMIDAHQKRLKERSAELNNADLHELSERAMHRIYARYCDDAAGLRQEGEACTDETLHKMYVTASTATSGTERSASAAKEKRAAVEAAEAEAAPLRLLVAELETRKAEAAAREDFEEAARIKKEAEAVAALLRAAESKIDAKGK